ncbi:MAG: 3-phosphoshikimate 1-carboxyvinyltransferase [Chloroflexi bacterium]|nr:3-phosphoshikimate 1-carboxyvinyltransferase [Chloroflexota bacterium]
MRETVTAPVSLAGEITPLGDKSIAHRALLLNVLAEGTARVENFPRGRDTLATLSSVQALGVAVDEESRLDYRSTFVVRSPGLGGLHEPAKVVDARNSGTTLRLLIGLLAGLPFFTVVAGDRSLQRRPMGRIVQPLRLMGANVWGRDGGEHAPLAIQGGSLHGISYDLPVASAQVKSSLLLAGVLAQGPTTLREPLSSRDHTERMLQAMGAHLRGEAGFIRLEPGAALHSLSIAIPGDMSGAAPWLLAGVLHPHARITVRGVGVNPTRTGLLDALRHMGARLTVASQGDQGGEPVADIIAESSQLHGVEIGGELVPRAIDELPLLALAGAFARGRTLIRDAAELRVKESDRVATTSLELSRLGVRIEERPDGMVIYGGQGLRGGTVRSHGDHRLALLLATAGLVCQESVAIEGSEAVDVSYPGFWSDLHRLAG